MDKHWTPIYITCGACYIDYNIFTKLEFIESDIKFVEKLFGFEKLGPFAKVRSSDNSNLVKSEIDNYNDLVESTVKIWAKIPLKERQILYKKFKPDFLLFGYDFAPFKDLMLKFLMDEQKLSLK